MPRFDERFTNYAFNKVQWLEHLRYTGYVFWVVTDAFGFDIPHPPWGEGRCVMIRSTYRKDFFKKMKETRKFPMKNVYHQFLREMHANFTNESVTPFCRRGQLFVDV